MEKIHNALVEKSKTYEEWHNHPHHKKFHWGIALLVVIVVLLIILRGIAYWQGTMFNSSLIKYAPRTATINLDPQTSTAKIGESFTVDIVVDTAGAPMDGADIYSLHYDPTVLSVVDSNTNQAGVQILPGSLMTVNVVNTVDPKTGVIRLSQASQGGTNFTGSGVLASVTFKALKAGNSNLRFDFKLGDTKDTNVAHGGRDRLLSVAQGTYTITE